MFDKNSALGALTVLDAAIDAKKLREHVQDLVDKTAKFEELKAEVRKGQAELQARERQCAKAEALIAEHGEKLGQAQSRHNAKAESDERSVVKKRREAESLFEEAKERNEDADEKFQLADAAHQKAEATMAKAEKLMEKAEAMRDDYKERKRKLKDIVD